MEIKDMKKGNWYLLICDNGIKLLYKFDKLENGLIYRTKAAVKPIGKEFYVAHGEGVALAEYVVSVAPASPSLVKLFFPEERLKVMFHEYEKN